MIRPGENPLLRYDAGRRGVVDSSSGEALFGRITDPIDRFADLWLEDARPVPPGGHKLPLRSYGGYIVHIEDGPELGRIVALDIREVRDGISRRHLAASQDDLRRFAEFVTKFEPPHQLSRVSMVIDNRASWQGKPVERAAGGFSVD